jgi:hypothetical protein
MTISSKIEQQKFSGLDSFDFQRVFFADSSAVTHVQHYLIERQSIGKINALFYRQEKYCWVSELSITAVLSPKSGDFRVFISPRCHVAGRGVGAEHQLPGHIRQLRHLGQRCPYSPLVSSLCYLRRLLLYHHLRRCLRVTSRTAFS